MLRYSFSMYREADIIEQAVAKVLDSKEDGGLEIRTGDLGKLKSLVTRLPTPSHPISSYPIITIHSHGWDTTTWAWPVYKYILTML